jgi:preprotein translocase subunit YajC
MNSFFISLGTVIPGNMTLLMVPPNGDGGNPMISFLPLVAIIGIFYFLIIRPQSKKQKDTQKMLSALKKGDKIVTIGGIHGTIQTVRENSLIVRVDENTKLEFSRSAISSVVSQAKEDKDDKKSDETDEDKKENSGESKE